MRTEYLKEFVTLQNHKDYYEAAQALFMSQITLVRHIKALESEVGHALVKHAGSRIELTDSGLAFLQFATKITEIEFECLQEINKTFKELNGTLTIGFNENMSAYQMTQIMNDFQTAYPNILVSVVSDSNEAIIDAVTNDKCDIAFIQKDPVTKINLQETTLLMDHLVAVLSEQHTLAGEETVSLTDLKGESFVFTDTQKSKMVSYCTNAGFQPHLIYPGSWEQMIYDLVDNGSCITLDWKCVAQKNSNKAKVVLKNLSPPIYTCISIIYKKEGSLSTVKNLFYRYVCGHEKCFFIE